VLGFLTGLVMIFTESENDHVRFHAAQSIVIFGALFVASTVLNFLQAIVGFSDIIGAVLGPLNGVRDVWCRNSKTPLGQGTLLPVVRV